jgi:hypothetical protein
MTSAENISSETRKASGWIHFAIATCILTATAVGFEWAIGALELATQKEAVPWPEGAIVDPDTFCLKNLPNEVGNRFFLAADGELPGADNGELPDGEVVVDDATREILRIGSSWDKTRISTRRSNWYAIRIYRDESRPEGHPLRYWRLEVYYYTGGLDTVPHVPERCLVTAGASLTGSAKVTFQSSHTNAPWDKPLTFRRTSYEISGQGEWGVRQFTQYYIFSLNGEPESSWEKVRLGLTNPFQRYCYFAKIQFAPLGETINIEQADQSAEEFMSYFLPVVLRNLPMSSDMEALESGETGEGQSIIPE